MLLRRSPCGIPEVESSAGTRPAAPHADHGPLRTSLPTAGADRRARSIASPPECLGDRPKSCRWDLNPGPRPYQGRALPTEPRQQCSNPTRRLGPIPPDPDPRRSPTRPSRSARPEPRAGDGNRTHVACLEGRYSTIELHPHAIPIRPWPVRSSGEPGSRGRDGGSRVEPTVLDVVLRLMSLIRASFRLDLPSMPAVDMGGAGFEPAKAVPPDLQSGPFGRLGIHPISGPDRRAARRPDGDAPATRRSTLSPRDRAGGESRTHNRRFTKPVLCRLSYASDLRP